MSYEVDQTPEIVSILPIQGQSGTAVTITGSKFSDNTADIVVTIGQSPCEVTSASANTIVCTVTPQSAGCYAVGVSIQGMGVATTADSACFKYLLTVDSVSPSVGGVSGGHMIMISGNGFFEFANSEVDSEELSYLPWFRYGVGIPNAGTMNYCPSFSETLTGYHTTVSFGDSSFILDDDFRVEDLNMYVLNIYDNGPLAVRVGDSPCIIVTATTTTISCIPMVGSPGTPVITVSVFDQTITLSSSYTISNDNTVIIENISPSSGSVTGGSNLVITGMRFGSESVVPGVEVMVGRKTCTVQSVIDTQIECITATHSAGSVQVFVATASGVAILQSALTGAENQVASVLFPTFTHELKITSASISEGSTLGGTEVSLSGVGLVDGETTVFVGGMSASVVSTSGSEIVCLSPTSSKVKTVPLSALLVSMGEYLSA